MRESARYFPELESLRGLAITLVFLHHVDALFTASQLSVARTRVWLPLAFVHAGHTGVSLFFVVSAFLLSQPFLVEAAGGKRVIRSDYYVRRVLRIVPLYWAAVLLAVAVCARGFTNVYHGLTYLAFIDLTPGFGSPLWPYNAVWWSLTTEVEFYILLPLLPLFLRSRAGRRWGGALLIGYAIVYTAFATGRLHAATFDAQARLWLSVLGRGPLFIFGTVAAWLYLRFGDAIRTWTARSAWVGRGGADVVLLVTFLALGGLLSGVVFVGVLKAESAWPAWHVLEGALWTGVLLLILLTPLRTKVFFSNPILKALGTLSYSIYMVHYPLLEFSVKALRAAQSPLIGWHAKTLGVTVALALACLTISTLTYWGIERPFLARKAKVDR